MIKNIGPKKWQVTIDGKSKEGKRTRHKKVIYGTQEEAKRYEKEKSEQKDRAGGILEPNKITVKDFMEKWISEVKAQQVKENTLESYRWINKLYINERLGSIQVSKLNAMQVQDLYTWMTEKKLSSRTIRYAHNVLSQALKQAVRWNIMLYNPAELAVLPKLQTKETQWMSKEEAKQFIKAIEGTNHELLFKLLLFTGMRPGEAFSLTWDCLDLDRGTITIKKTLTRPNNAAWILTDPKTSKSKRTIPLSKELLKAFRMHQRNQEAIKGEAEAYYSGYHFIFATGNGQPLDHSNVVSRDYKPALERANIRPLPIYSLRHTAATLLLEAGEDVKTISERLGHKDITLTLNTYAHVTEGMQQRATDRMAKILQM